VPGAPPAAIRLEPSEGGVVVEAAAAGVRLGGRALRPGARRLIRPGEALELARASISFPDPAAAGTRAGAAALLRGAGLGATPLAGPHLVVLTGPEAGRRHAVRTEQVVGRGPRADVRLGDPGASRRHARLRLDGGSASLEDLGAKNGVRVNGVRVRRGRVPLAPGDEIAIGDTVLALQGAVAPAEEEAAATPPADAGGGGDPGDGASAGAGLAASSRRRRLSVVAELAAALLLAVSAAALALAGG
jgi:hypothetical protein